MMAHLLPAGTPEEVLAALYMAYSLQQYGPAPPATAAHTSTAAAAPDSSAAAPSAPSPAEQREGAQGAQGGSRPSPPLPLPLLFRRHLPLVLSRGPGEVAKLEAFRQANTDAQLQHPVPPGAAAPPGGRAGGRVGSGGGAVPNLYPAWYRVPPLGVGLLG